MQFYKMMVADLSVQHFTWRPGVGINEPALKRLQCSLQRPAEPMGEAWFMGEHRRLFFELWGDLDSLPTQQLQEPLGEIASGTCSFGALEEWRNWYYYLLAQLLPRSHEAYVNSLLEILITAFMALHPNGVGEQPYPEFHEDVLLTLGRSMMEPACWNGSEIVVGTFLHRSNNNPNKVWCWWDASGDFSASMYFCLKYLPASSIQAWYASVLAIESPHWRAQVLVWLVGSHGMLTGELLWPSQWNIGAYPKVNWEWSHCLGPEAVDFAGSGLPAFTAFFPEAARSSILKSTFAYFTDDVFLMWLESIARIPYLESELADIPSTFEQLYVCSSRRGPHIH